MKNSKQEKGVIEASILRLERKVDSLHSQLIMQKDWLTTREACLYLAVQRTQLWKLVTAGKIQKPKKNEAGRNRYEMADLKAYIQNEFV